MYSRNILGVTYIYIYIYKMADTHKNKNNLKWRLS